MVKTGKYHKHNYLKFLIFRELLEIYPKGITVNELAEILGIEKEKISNRLSVYHHYGYVGRRKVNKPNPKSNRKVWRYQINILGIDVFLKLRALYNMGRELNLRKLNNGKPLQEIDSYTGETLAAIEGNT